jgi:hypothetical protein
MRKFVAEMGWFFSFSYGILTFGTLLSQKILGKLYEIFVS